MQITSREDRLEVCLKVFQTRCPTKAGGGAREVCLTQVGLAANCLVRHATTAPEAFSAIVSRLKDGDPEVRATSVAVLGDLGPAAKEAIPALIEALKDKHGRIAEFASDSLGQIGPEATPAVKKALVALKGSPVAQDWAGIALGKIGEPALPALIEALKDPALRFSAVLGIQRVGKAQQALPALVAVLADERVPVRAQALEALRRIGPTKEALPALLRMLDDPDLDTTLKALYLIGDVGSDAASALPVLRGIASDNRIGSRNNNDRIKSAANSTIKKIEGKLSPRK